jgi:hypothetical protein
MNRGAYSAVHKAPLRRIVKLVETEPSLVGYLLECGHTAIKDPFQSVKSVGERRRCVRCLKERESGMTAPLPLPALTEASCPDCQGAGGWDDEQGPLMCFTCCGTGRVEACPVCGEVPTVIAGNDACGCTFAGAFEHPEIIYGRQIGWLDEAA